MATDATIILDGTEVFRGVIDASANPNYPAARKGDMYVVSVQGFLGGISGVGARVLVNDIVLARVDTIAGNQAAVGANWVKNGDRKLPMVTAIVSSATPVVDTDFTDAVSITALAANITSMTTSLAGSPVNFQKLLYRIKDNGVARTIAWGAKFSTRTVALPTTTIAGKVLVVGFFYDTLTATWGCVAAGNEP